MQPVSPLAEQANLQRRRFLAMRRKEREEQRLNLLDACLADFETATKIRQWADWIAPQAEGEPEITRLVGWARNNAANLEAKSSAAMTRMGLKELFPEVDDLHDPLGEPAPKHPWGL